MNLQRPKTSPARIVPAIPDLSAIRDGPTRAALEAIADGLAVRNGFKGGGQHRFLTIEDLKEVDFKALGNRTIAAAAADGGGGFLNENGAPKPGQIAALINDLSASIIESPLFRDLGERVDLIDKPTTGVIARIGNAEIGLASERTQRINADNAINIDITTRFAAVNSSLSIIQVSQTTIANSVSALSSQMTTVQASVSANAVAIQQEATARASADGALQAQWSVKIDANGYVSGFGLSSTANNSTPFSEFYIRADRFAIASPTVPHTPGVPPPVANIPFIVQTTNWTDSNGKTQAPGVFMRSAFIEYAAIDQARIRDLAVTTLKIGNDAVTLPAAAYAATATQLSGAATKVELIRCVVDYSPASGDNASQAELNSKYLPRARLVMFNGLFDQPTGSGDQILLSLQRYAARYNSGTGQYEIDPTYASSPRVFVEPTITIPNNVSTTFPITIIDSDAPGFSQMGTRAFIYMVKAWLRDVSATVNPNNLSLVILGAKR